MNSTNKTEDYFIYYKMIEGIFYNFIAIRYDKANIVKWHRFKCRFNLETLFMAIFAFFLYISLDIKYVYQFVKYMSKRLKDT